MKSDLNDSMKHENKGNLEGGEHLHIEAARCGLLPRGVLSFPHPLCFEVSSGCISGRTVYKYPVAEASPFPSHIFLGSCVFQKEDSRETSNFCTVAFQNFFLIYFYALHNRSSYP